MNEACLNKSIGFVQFSPVQPLLYYLLAFLFTIFIRVAISSFKALMLMNSPGKTRGSFFEIWWIIFWDNSARVSSDERDYRLPFYIGFLEMCIYPFLMHCDKWEMIGAWLTFKTVGQFHRWGENRSTFQRFLLGNILVLLCSFFILSRFFIN